MKTNDIKKGMRVLLRNGWYGTMADNMRGTIRMVDVEGFEREIGSVYAHDISHVRPVVDANGMGSFVAVEHTPAQLKLRKLVEAI